MPPGGPLLQIRPPGVRRGRGRPTQDGAQEAEDDASASSPLTAAGGAAGSGRAGRAPLGILPDAPGPAE